MTLRRSLLLLTLACLAARLATMPSYVEETDGFHFVAGVERYSTAEMRPHFPGYPVYIWAGKLLARLTGDAPRALHLLSVLASTLTLWPLALLARAWSASLGSGPEEARRAAFGAALVWALAPLSWLVGSEILSDPLALLLGLGALGACWRSLDSPERAGTDLVVAAVAFGLMIGVRLPSLLLVLPLPFTVWLNRRRPVAARAAVAFTAAVVGWLGWQLEREGAGFLRAGISHIEWNIHNPGTTMLFDENPLGRPLLLLRIVVHGLGGWWPADPLARVPVTVAVAAVLGAAAQRVARAGSAPARILPWLFVGPYVVGAVVGLDLRTQRYGLPLVALAALLVGVGLPRARWPARLALASLCVAMAVVSLPLALDHRDVAPTGAKLARYLKAHFDPARTMVLLSELEAPTVGNYLAAEASGFLLAAVDPEGRTARRFEASGYTILATEPAATTPGEWVPVARFCRSAFLDPRGPLELWLFRHEPAARGFQSLPACQ